MSSAGHGFDEPPHGQDIRLVVDAIPGLVWLTRPDGSADVFNQRWLEYTGLSPEQAVDSGWKDAIHPDDLLRMLETFHEALHLGRSFEVEGRFRRWDGEFRRFLFRGSALLDQAGKVVKWYRTNIDLHDRKRAEEALRASETYRRLIVDSILGLVCTMSAAGEIELFNLQTLEYFGKTSEELKNWATSDAVHPQDRPRVLTAFARSVETGQFFEIER